MTNESKVKRVAVKAQSRRTRRTGTKKKAEAKSEQATTEEELTGEYTETGGTEEAVTPMDGLLGGLANKATRIVEQAASILEEEIASGIVAAKNVEERYVNVSNLRTGDPEKVMQRFRNDAHEVVDILLDLVNVSINSLGGLTRRVVSVQSRPLAEGSKTAGTAGISALVIPGTLKENETGEISMLIENDGDTPTEEFNFKCASLLSASDGSISPRHIQFSPKKIAVGPNTFEKIVVSVKVPKDTKPGVYSGLLQATKLSHVRAVLTVVVDK
jgi:hypothetical protein